MAVYSVAPKAYKMVVVLDVRRAERKVGKWVVHLAVYSVAPMAD